jgi:hypothetical protein
VDLLQMTTKNGLGIPSSLHRKRNPHPRPENSYDTLA